MAPDRLAGPTELSGTPVLPFRGEQGRAPSSVLVRQAVGAVVDALEVVRSALAVAAALAESFGSDEREVVEGPTGVSELVCRTGLTGVEVVEALRALREAHVLDVREERLHLNADLYCVLPVLARLDWEGCRSAIAGSNGRLAPALALLRELARSSRFAADGGGEWLHPSVQELVEETLYGRTAVSQALGELARAGLVTRAEQAPRRGLRVRLNSSALGSVKTARPHQTPASRASKRTRPSEERAGEGVTVTIGGAEIGVPAGSRLELPQGMDYRLEIGPDGGAIIRIDH